MFFKKWKTKEVVDHEAYLKAKREARTVEDKA